MREYVINALKTPVNLTTITNSITNISIQKILKKVTKIEEAVN